MKKLLKYRNTEEIVCLPERDLPTPPAVTAHWGDGAAVGKSMEAIQLHFRSTHQSLQRRVPEPTSAVIKANRAHV